MKKGKLLMTLGTAALVGVVGMGSTLAYFTDSEETANVLTTGRVNISITGAETDDRILVPGDTVNYNPVVTVEEQSNDAYLRYHMSITLKDQDGNNLLADGNAYEEAFQDMVKETLAASDLENGTWFFDDFQVNEEGVYTGYAYYTEKAEDGENTETAGKVEAGDVIGLFSEETGSFVIPAKWGNEWADTTMDISVVAEAVQAEHFQVVREDGIIVSWDDVTIESYE